MSKKRTAVIIGAGPAGLTAAYELLTRTDIQPIILEKSGYMGGIAKTVSYKGNKIDIGGHRFFSKSDRVMDWWLKILPADTDVSGPVTISYQNKSRDINPAAQPDKQPADADKIMLIRKRQSRIYYLKKFFNYPVSLSADTLGKLGFARVLKIGISYTLARLFPIKPEKNLEDFFINRFGKELYHTFFKDYTEKVWGTPCKEIAPEWGAQRIKKLTIGKAIVHAIKTTVKRNNKADISQKETETSLIEQFMYPKYGPGQLWEEVASQAEQMGGIIYKFQNVVQINHDGQNILSIETSDTQTGERKKFEADYFFSTMPVKELVNAMQPAAPALIKEIANGLLYRDIIVVGLLMKELKVKDETQANRLIKDNWIYIQEKNVKIGRLQIMNNWSPYMVKDPETVWLGLEFFCNEGDALWQKDDEDFIRFAIDELTEIEIIRREDVLDKTILREEKAYPAYFGSYDRFAEIQAYTDSFENLFLTGRNGMHKYNNSDHSMLTAMTAVDNIIAGRKDKANIWAINTEQEYHEKK